MKSKTEQEKFWMSEFGNNYIDRNQISELLTSKIHLFSNILKHTQGVNSFMEFGSNIGTNLLAINQLKPNASLNALEINRDACKKLKSLNICDEVWEGSILENIKLKKTSLTFTCGVLIHINPDSLMKAYEKLYKWSEKYILICEYFNPTPIKIDYRGHNDKLFKRDFAGELLKKYKDLSLVYYEFCYKNDNNFPMDNITWFLMKKNKV